MSLGSQIFVVIGCYILAFSFIRWFLWGVKRYGLNNSAYKKRKKGETLKEWFLYTRYHDEIPKILRILYFTIVLIHPLILTLCIVFNFMQSLSKFGPVLAKGIALFDSIWFVMIYILFWQVSPGFKIERWITKKRGNKKNK